MSGLCFSEDGVELAPLAAKSTIAAIADVFPDDQPGYRFAELGSLKPFLTNNGAIGALAAAKIGKTARPVRMIAFNKSDANNWALGWHQDRTIFAGPKAQVSGFGPWSKKQGLVHVEPPFPIIMRMATLRIHVDPVDSSNAPLRVALRSHCSGKIPESQIEAIARKSTIHDCLAASGDVWICSTPILHASKRSSSSGQRRVLQVDYSVDELPAPIQWTLA